MSVGLSSGKFSLASELVSINRPFILPFKTVTPPPNNILVGAVEFSLLAFAAVLTTANLLDHDGSVA